MTNQERAEKIGEQIGQYILLRDEIHDQLVKICASQLDEAVREASNAKFDNISQEYYLLGFAAAREKAAKEADEMNEPLVAERIRGMWPDK